MIPITAIPKTWLIIGLLLLSNGFIFWRLSAAQETIGELRSSVAQLKETNRSNQELIENLNNRYTDLVNERAADLERAEAAVAQARAEAEQLQNRLENSRTEREIIYAENPDANQWGRTVVPGLIADSLRD